MSTMVVEVYDALRRAGVDEQLAKDAARAVLASDALPDLATRAALAVVEAEMATKADLAVVRADLAELKADLIKWNVGAMAVLTAIFAAVVRLG